MYWRERLMKRLTTVVIALACGVGAVWADTDPIAQRRALMKSDGMAAKKLFDMSKGKRHSISRRCRPR
jgi:cytochrome c556